MNFEPVTFRTFAAPHYDVTKEKRIRTALFCTAGILLLIGIRFITVHWFLALISGILFISISGYNYVRSKNTLFYFNPIGTLTLGQSGFHISQETRADIPFESVHRAAYKMERMGGGGEFAKLKTHELIIVLHSGERIILFVENNPINAKWNSPNFETTMEFLRTNNYLLRKIIRDIN